MKNKKSDCNKDILDGQQRYWGNMFVLRPDIFGAEPSEPARNAVDFFQRQGCSKMLELGAGQGRDTVFFA